MQNRKGFRAEKKDVKVRPEAETRERLPTEWLFAQKTEEMCIHLEVRRERFHVWMAPA